MSSGEASGGVVVIQSHRLGEPGESVRFFAQGLSYQGEWFTVGDRKGYADVPAVRVAITAHIGRWSEYNGMRSSIDVRTPAAYRVLRYMEIVDVVMVSDEDLAPESAPDADVAGERWQLPACLEDDGA